MSVITFSMRVRRRWRALAVDGMFLGKTVDWRREWKTTEIFCDIFSKKSTLCPSSAHLVPSQQIIWFLRLRHSHTYLMNMPRRANAKTSALYFFSPPQHSTTTPALLLETTFAQKTLRALYKKNKFTSGPKRFRNYDGPAPASIETTTTTARRARSATSSPACRSRPSDLRRGHGTDLFVNIRQIDFTSSHQ